jgi:hypothetical protein
VVVVVWSCSSGVVHWAPSQDLRCWRAELTCCEILICQGLVLYVDARSLRGDLVLVLIFDDGWWRFYGSVVDLLEGLSVGFGEGAHVGQF